MCSSLGGATRAALVLLFALTLPAVAQAQTFVGTLPGATPDWLRHASACGGTESATRTYERLVVFVERTGTYSVTATRTSGTGIALDAYRSFPSFDCMNDRIARGTSHGSTATMEFEVTTLDYPIVLVVSSGQVKSAGGYVLTV